MAPAMIYAKKFIFQDTQNSSEVITFLKEAARKYQQTIVMITHNRSISQTADRILQVSDGILTDLGRCRE